MGGVAVFGSDRWVAGGMVVLTVAFASAGPLPAPPAVSTEVTEALRRRLESAGMQRALEVDGEVVHAKDGLARFFEARSFAPAWHESGDIAQWAEELLETLRGAEDEGLNPADYHLARLEALVKKRAQAESMTARVGRMVDRELLLTDAFLLYGSHLLAGRVNPVTTDSEWFVTGREGDVVSVLGDAISSRSVGLALHTLLPAHPDYGALKGMLRRYRSLAAAGGWPSLPPGAALKNGAQDPRVGALRRRLVLGGDYRAEVKAPDQDLFDTRLDEALRRFQSRHGLDPDGVVGPRTLVELNTSAEQRVRQVTANLERWRWLPQSLGDRYVLVNIAGFSLRSVDGSSETQMRVVVGRSYRRTPVFSDQITYLVLNPRWNVPDSIAVQDVLPAVRRDAGYLAAQRIKVLQGWGEATREIDPASVDWRALGPGRFPYRLVQEPGPSNSLGRIKFMFPNRFNIYLHDTPAQHLFGRADRDASSGCIRVEHPLELAGFLLRGNPGWSAARLRQELDAGTEQTVRLQRPVPVHILYWTAWVGDDGTTNFRRDLYGRDERLLAELAERPPGA